VETDIKTLREILCSHDGRPGPLLPILHDVQAQAGYISEDAIRVIADHLNLSRAEVSGVVSFYPDFHRTADPRPAIKFCRAEACQARGSETLAKQAAVLAGDRVRVETVFCLGLCSAGPNAMVGEDVHARLDGDRIAALIGSL